MIAVLAGGVGAARFLRGLVQVVPAHDVVAVVNTADDVVLHGLHVSPDIDTVVYTLSGASDAERGWGLAGETWAVMDELRRYADVAPPDSDAGTTWFRLGDRDLATHLYRTQRLREGAPLSRVTAELALARGVAARVLPMSDDRVETRVELTEEGEVGFQEYFVRRRHAVTVTDIRFDGIEHAQPAPGVVEALIDAEVVVIAPSNPMVSIAPVVAVPGIRPVLERRRGEVVAVSPIVGGAALKGPADRLMRELGHEVSAVGVARVYAPFASTMVVDVTDAALAPRIEAEGVSCLVAPTVMHGPAEAAALARAVLSTRQAA